VRGRVTEPGEFLELTGDGLRSAATHQSGPGQRHPARFPTLCQHIATARILEQEWISLQVRGSRHRQYFPRASRPV
jgi:hypothetical protein